MLEWQIEQRFHERAGKAVNTTGAPLLDLQQTLLAQVSRFIRYSSGASGHVRTLLAEAGYIHLQYGQQQWHYLFQPEPPARRHLSSNQEMVCRFFVRHL